MSGAIKPPSGKPFDIIGTDNAMDAVKALSIDAGSSVVFDRTREVYELYSVIADRDHQYHQVTLAQAATTAEVFARRKSEATLRGAMSYVHGEDKDSSNPYDRVREDTLWGAWSEGYDIARSKHDLSWRSYAMEARYQGSLAAARGETVAANPHSDRTNMRSWWIEGHAATLLVLKPRLVVAKVADQLIAVQAPSEPGIPTDHPSMTLPLTGVYGDNATTSMGGWLGWIEPTDKAWLAFVSMDGVICLWQERRAEDGAVIGNPILLHRAASVKP